MSNAKKSDESTSVERKEGEQLMNVNGPEKKITITHQINQSSKPEQQSADPGINEDDKNCPDPAPNTEPEDGSFCEFQ